MGISIDTGTFREEDFADWLVLWNANNRGICHEITTAETWRRILEPGNPVNGLGAWLNGAMAGICHYVIHSTTGSIEPVCYMQDLFVDSGYRRRGVARALLAALEEEGRRQGWRRIYWLAETKNDAAARLYEKTGYKLDFSFHVLPLS